MTKLDPNWGKGALAPSQLRASTSAAVGKVPPHRQRRPESRCACLLRSIPERTLPFLGGTNTGYNLLRKLRCIEG